ncbi:MAG: arginyltransferase [Emcibacter sp.]|nr:arginyltransferase [Emcibacter sp.]
MTAPNICPYLERRMERKVFTELDNINPAGLHESMARIGFRRSQDIVYRPSCDECSECKSVRIPVSSFSPSRTQRRLINMNSDLTAKIIPNKATEEHYQLLTAYLARRHTDGGMANMSFDEYVSMVESSPVDTSLIEYRLQDNGKDTLIAVALTDIMTESLSMVYSFFAVGEDFKKRSIGTYLILDHIARAQKMAKRHVYLGYWVKDSPKMAYKKNFHPLEILEPEGWFVSKKP